MNMHDVRHDPSVTGHDRWTCHGLDHDEETCLKAPWMSQATWEGRLAAFMNEHEYSPDTREGGVKAPPAAT